MNDIIREIFKYFKTMKNVKNKILMFDKVYMFKLTE